MRSANLNNPKLIELTFILLEENSYDWQEIHKEYKKRHDVDQAILSTIIHFDAYKVYRAMFCRKYRGLIHYINTYKKGNIEDGKIRCVI